MDTLRANRIIPYLLLSAVTLLSLVMCRPEPQPTASPLRLPTRAPRTPTPTPIDPRIYYDAGVSQRTMGDPIQALQNLSQTLELDPDFAPAHVERGSLYLQMGKPDAALADAQAALVDDPENATAYALLGEVLRVGFGAPVQALEAYRQAVQLDPDLAGATFPARWRAAVTAGRSDRMTALANEYINAHPEDPLGGYYLGQALIEQGLTRAAIRNLLEQLENGGPAAVWFTLGDAYAVEGAWASARTCYEEARKLVQAGDDSLSLVSHNPTADLFGALGAAYLYTGRCNDAQIMLDYALARDPDRSHYHTLIGQAMICQTPTPTPTPYPWLR